MILTLADVTRSFGALKVTDDVSFSVPQGQALGIIGPNGAGKSTLLRSITGVLRNDPGMVLHRGEPIGALPPEVVMRRGIAMVPEGRKLFPSLSVEENLLIGGQTRRANGPWSLSAIYDLFPILHAKRQAPGTSLSGGQQQMVAIGRALMSNPEVLLCDEISLGLAPVVIRDIYAALPAIKASGAAVIVVEQDIARALSVADRVYCMMEGRVTLTAPAAQVTRAEIHQAYFGGAA